MMADEKRPQQGLRFDDDLYPAWAHAQVDAAEMADPLDFAEEIPAHILAHDHVWELAPWMCVETCVCGMLRARRALRATGKLAPSGPRPADMLDRARKREMGND